MSWVEEAIAYLRKHREYVLRDLNSLKAGHLAIAEQKAGKVVDVTDDWIAKRERQLAYIDNIIDAYEREP